MSELNETIEKNRKPEPALPESQSQSEEKTEEAKKKLEELSDYLKVYLESLSELRKSEGSGFLEQVVESEGFSADSLANIPEPSIGNLGGDLGVSNFEKPRSQPVEIQLLYVVEYLLAEPNFRKFSISNEQIVAMTEKAFKSIDKQSERFDFSHQSGLFKKLLNKAVKAFVINQSLEDLKDRQILKQVILQLL